LTQSTATQTTVPFYRDIKKLAVLAQVAFLVLVIAGVIVIVNNVQVGLKKNGLQFSFDFLTRTAGFQIAEGTAFGNVYDSGADNYIKAILVGLYNTLRVSIAGIVLATLLGVFVGIARLSSNWLVSRIALVYVEILRNTPLLVQLIVWYYLVILRLPPFRNAVQVGTVFLSNQGLALPWAVQKEGSANFLPVWTIALIVGIGVYALFARIRAQSGKPNLAGWFGFGAWLAVVVIGLVVLQWPLELGIPMKSKFGVTGGLQISPEFTALLVGLTVYTSSFIAEIVRAGIQSVNKGQWEASRALGFNYAETLQLIVLPQALRVMIPPLGNQFLNLTKNSSLAVAIGFSDLLNVLGTAGNQSGQNLQTFAIAGVVYLALSLMIAGVVNWYNRATRLVTR
jgi:general L-amino acid transport system permease protein